MKTFKTFELMDGMRPCKKKPITVYAKQIHEEFRVDTLEGNYKQGKPGDYLIKGIEGELYICDKEIFEKTYDFIDNKTCRDCKYYVTDYDGTHDWCEYPNDISDEMDAYMHNNEIDDINNICNSFKLMENTNGKHV